MRLRVDGIDETLAMLDRADDVKGKVDALRRDFAFGVLAGIQRAAPVRTGFLRASAFAATHGDDAVFIDYAGYARYVDLGTGRRGGASYEAYLPEEEPVAFASYWPGMAAQPFMRAPIAAGLEELDHRIDDIAGDVA